MLRLEGKKALVTGAAQGLGEAIARHLAIAGAQVLLTDRDEEGAARAATAISGETGTGSALAFRHDVTSEGDWAAAIDHARSAMGGLTTLVNNAGIALGGNIEELTLDEWRHGTAVNVDSVFLGCKSALPLMRESGPGSIINISSISAMIAAPSMANYNATKAAVWMLTKSVALHCAKGGWDIRCNSVHPTFVRTEMLLGLIGGHDHEAGLAKLARQIPLGRIGAPSDVGHAVVYLASDESRFMTGSELKLDGGISAM